MLEQLTEKRVWQDLISSPGWQLFNDQLLVKFRAQEMKRLESAGNRGDGLQCAKHAYLLEMLPIILRIPEQELKKLNQGE